MKVEQAKEYLEAKEQLEKAVAMSNVMIEQNRIINSKFEDNVDKLKEQFEKALARYTDTILANLSTILHVKAQVEQKEPESLSSKVMSAVKENIPIPKSKEISIDEMIKDKTYDEIKEIYNNLAEKHKTNISDKEKTKVYDTCMKLADILDKMKKEGKKK